jgi:hypothetical protein
VELFVQELRDDVEPAVQVQTPAPAVKDAEQ